MTNQSISNASLANALRALAMDGVQAAKSGHPGAPMGMAEMAVALWHEHLKHHPSEPLWQNRDRFVLSNGHASMLLYALLHLTGYSSVPLAEIRKFRQLHSKTPGHPENTLTAGVETTTGPLGQGVANAVGMALAEKLLAQEFNEPKHPIVDHHTYVFMGDGCLMEGISHEACALAGAWKLSKLVALYDDNQISIDGPVAPWYVDQVADRFRSYQWNVIGPIDGNDVIAVKAAIASAKQQTVAPTLIICKTQIGKGSPNRQGTAKAHGEPLGEAEIQLTRQALGWQAGPFEIPADVSRAWNAQNRGAQSYESWQSAWQAYAAAFPAKAEQLKRRISGDLPSGWLDKLRGATAPTSNSPAAIATRKSSQIALEALTSELTELIGGSADLTGSNLTQTSHTPALRFDGKGQPNGGRHINYGVREFAMAAIMNGVALHGGYIPYGGTFLTFSDYSRNAIRMAALMRLRVIHVFTHDSIGLGEDGPTHQSVEHAASLRLIPGLDVWRPADNHETMVAWTHAIQRKDGPSALLLSRQALPQLPSGPNMTQASLGGYVVSEAAELGLASAKPDIVLIATGSEVQLALHAQERLSKDRIAARVVSVPSTSVFDRQSASYKLKVLPEGVPRLAIEAGVTDGWWKYGCSAVVGLDRYGESAPAEELFEYFHITADNLYATAVEVLRRARNAHQPSPAKATGRAKPPRAKG
jgi:transketolase